MKCDSCGSEMRKTGYFFSGNAKFTEWVCQNCINTKTSCDGVSGVLK